MAEVAVGAPAGAVTLLVPEDDVADPEVSIVIPALNEELTVRDFVGWCREGLARAGVAGEVLIVDSSTDATAEIAVSQGARVLCVPRRGLGRAYIDALPYVRGRFVLMGDADCTYDFRELAAFVQRFREGYEFVMGSRWKGSIEPGSMPPLHQYLGTPVTTWILNRMYSSHFSDIHCGMRGITTEALARMRLQSQSWEYASEMVLKSVHMRLRTAEVPVSFLKDREGRLSHHKRAGWTSPFKAAWINLRAMFVYGAEFFLLKPGLLMLALGLGITLPLALGPVSVGRVTFSLYWMLLGVTLSLLGLQSFLLSCLAQVLHDYTGSARARWLRVFPYTRTVALSALAFVAGLGLAALLVARYVRSGLALSPEDLETHVAVIGLLLMIASFMTFTNTLLLHAAALHSRTLHDRKSALMTLTGTGTFTSVFVQETVSILEALSQDAVERLATGLAGVRERGGRLFILGVGGSAGHAGHAVNDFRKLCGMEAYAPTDNVSELTARINDDGWDTAFAEWLRGSRICDRDAVLVFSVGGGDRERNISVNLVRAVELARAEGASVFGIVGRDGGFTASAADVAVVIPPLHPQRVTAHTEGLCAVVWHLLVSHPALQRAPMKWESTR